MCARRFVFRDDDARDIVPAFANSIDSRLIMASEKCYVSSHLLHAFDQRLIHQSVSFSGEVSVYNATYSNCTNKDESPPFVLGKRLFTDAWRRHRVMRTAFLDDDQRARVRVFFFSTKTCAPAKD